MPFKEKFKHGDKVIIEMKPDELDKLIKDCQREMEDWFGVIVSDEAAEDFITRHDVESFDTWERSVFINEIARKVTGMYWPSNGDSQEYKDEFYKKFYGEQTEWNYGKIVH